MSKDWTGNKKSTYATLGASNHTETERQTDDFYATNPESLKVFLERLKDDGIHLHESVWECACGQGHLSKTLEQAGFTVISTDLVDRGYGESNVNFLETEYKPEQVDILTNPPYKYAQQFVEHAMELSTDGDYVVMFLKIQFLEGKARRELFKKYPPKYVYVFSERQTCAMNGNFDKYCQSALCYCWYIWEKGFNGEPKIRWL